MSGRIIAKHLLAGTWCSQAFLRLFAGKSRLLPGCTLFLDTSEPASRFRELERYKAKTSEDRSESRSTLQVVNEHPSLFLTQ
jgi:hypothetical protein